MYTELTYKEKKYSNNYEEVERTIRVHKEWGMYTAQGNQVMRKKAENLVKNILKEKNGNRSAIKYLQLFDKYFKSYQKSADENKICSGAHDTAVREEIWFFAESVAKSIRISSDSLDDLWDQRHRYKRKSK